jgi:hypothetical protein
MKKGFYFLILLIFVFANSYSIENYPAGARSRSLSNAFVSISDIWSTFHNQAGIAGLSGVSAGFYYESRFMIDELTQVAGTLVLPTKSGNFGISFSQFGKGSFKENKLGIAFAKSLSEKLSAAVQLDYLSQILPENSRAKGFATFEAGIIYTTNQKLYLGAHVFNPILGGIETLEGKLQTPASFRLGGHYQFDNLVMLIVEAQKDTKNPLILKTGIEFSPVQNLALRFGVSGKPFNYTAGIGYRFGKITTDIGFGYHGNLGITPSVSVQFEL